MCCNPISGVTTPQAERHSKSGVSHNAVMFSRLRRDGYEVVAAVLKIVGRVGISLRVLGVVVLRVDYWVSLT